MTSPAPARLAIFGRRVGELMGPPPPVVGTDASCRNALRVMRAGREVSVVVLDGAEPAGIFTEHDVAHRVADRLPFAAPVGEVMTRPLRTVGEDDYVLYAIAELQRLGLSRIPVLNAGRAVVGMLQLTDALGATLANELELARDLTHGTAPEDLRRSKAAQVRLVEQFLAEGISGPEVQRLLTDANLYLYRRVVEGSLAALRAEGRGDPPVAFDMIAMGSTGRGENFLTPDQDNGFILEDYPESEHDRIDGWFVELAERVCDGLAAAGIPRCGGHVMAVNPLWRKQRSEWRAQLLGWLRRRSNATLCLCDIFFDFGPACGEGRLATELRDYVTALMPRQHLFLATMNEVQADHNVALGLFGRFVTDSGEHRGELNMKYHAWLPMVESVRLLALHHGVGAAGTRERVDALEAVGVLSADEGGYLRSAQAQLSDLLLRRQVADARAGRSPSHYLPLSGLRERDRDLLVHHLRAIRDLKARINDEFSALI